MVIAVGEVRRIIFYLIDLEASYTLINHSVQNVG